MTSSIVFNLSSELVVLIYTVTSRHIAGLLLRTALMVTFFAAHAESKIRLLPSKRPSVEVKRISLSVNGSQLPLEHLPSMLI